jgi:hypothetical protein
VCRVPHGMRVCVLLRTDALTSNLLGVGNGSSSTSLSESSMTAAGAGEALRGCTELADAAAPPAAAAVLPPVESVSLFDRSFLCLFICSSG